MFPREALTGGTKPSLTHDHQDQGFLGKYFVCHTSNTSWAFTLGHLDSTSMLAGPGDLLSGRGGIIGLGPTRGDHKWVTRRS